MSEIVDSSLKTAAKGTALVFFGSAASFLIGFLTRLLIVRNTTVEELGLYSLAVTVVTLVSVVLGTGLHEGATRYVSIFLGEGRKEDADSIARTSLKVGIVSGTIVFLLLFSLSGVISRHVFYKPELEEPLKVVSFFIPVYIMSLITSGILRGHGIIRAKVYYLDIGMQIFFIALIGTAILLRLPFISILYAYVVSAAIVFVAIGSYGYKKIRLNPFSFKGGGFGEKVLGFSIPISITGVMTMMLDWTDTLMLGRYAGTQEVGIYSVSVTLARVIAFPIFAFGFVFIPIAGDMFARGHSSELKRTYQVLTKWMFAMTMPIFLVVFFFSETLITTFFGGRFVDAAIPLRILSLGFLIQSFLGMSGHVMTVLGMMRALLVASAVGAALNLVLNYVLIKQFGLGMMGASTATAISYTLISLICAAILHMETGIHPFIPSYLKPVFLSVACGIIIYLATIKLPLYLWMLPIYFVFFVGGYVIATLLTGGLDSEDVFLFDSIMRKTGLELEWLKRVIYRFVRN